MDFFEQEVLPFGEEYRLDLSPLGDEYSIEPVDSQEQQEDGRVSSPSLYPEPTCGPGKSEGYNFSEEALRQQLIGLVSQQFVDVVHDLEFIDVPQKAAATPTIELTLSHQDEGDTTPESNVILTSLASSPRDNAASHLLDFASLDLQLDAPDPEQLFNFGPISEPVAQEVHQGAHEVTDDGFDSLPTLLEPFQPADLHTISPDELESILCSYPSSPSEIVSASQSGSLSSADQPALAGFEEEEELKPQARVERRARAARASRVRKAKPYDDFVLVEEPEVRQRGRPSDPTIRPPDRKSRKKEQNKDAALRYRQKKKKEMSSICGEYQQLEDKNKKLKGKVEELTHDIDLLKSVLREKYQKEGKQLPAVLKSK